ncbi:MAG: hypothetical protein CME43_09285 [Haliea sp.]|uniref:PP2C family protein-serine/threonine phosphatase n=1 Tax=Haliea sp. TaxID=1932666 RepID=UPI000C68DFBD|nr:protein phosphatase 2C domain-containing protein [Haliea sp.]MBM69655.1 hypothetical protein [Haliea sp.]
MTTLDTAGFSHVGARRHNEDALLLCDDLGLYAVADGVGGLHGGEVASRIVCDTLEAGLRAGLSLSAAMDRAHAEVLSAAARGEGVPGSASTAVAVTLDKARLQLAWVGDSRAYVWDGELQLLSKDHSLVQTLVDTAQLDFAEIEHHPQKNVISQALGSRSGTPVTAYKEGSLKTPCVLMLCSDGVSGELSERRLIDTLASGESAEACARSLVEAAVGGGGQDNASCIIIRVPKMGLPLATESTLAFMRYGADNRWHLAETVAGGDTQMNPKVADHTQTLALPAKAEQPPAVKKKLSLLRIVTGTTFSVMLVVGLIYALERTTALQSILALIAHD